MWYIAVWLACHWVNLGIQLLGKEESTELSTSFLLDHRILQGFSGYLGIAKNKRSLNVLFLGINPLWRSYSMESMKMIADIDLTWLNAHMPGDLSACSMKDCQLLEGLLESAEFTYLSGKRWLNIEWNEFRHLIPFALFFMEWSSRDLVQNRCVFRVRWIPVVTSCGFIWEDRWKIPIISYSEPSII